MARSTLQPPRPLLLLLVAAVAILVIASATTTIATGTAATAGSSSSLCRKGTGVAEGSCRAADAVAVASSKVGQRAVYRSGSATSVMGRHLESSVGPAAPMVMALSSLDPSVSVVVSTNTSNTPLFEAVGGRSATGYAPVTAGPLAVMVSTTSMTPITVYFTAIPGHVYTVAIGQLPGQFLLVEVLDDTVEWGPDHIDLAAVRWLNMDPYHTTISAYSVSSNCFECLKTLREVAEFPLFGNAEFITLLVQHDTVLEFKANGVSMSNMTIDFQEQGIYSVVIPSSSDTNNWVPPYVVTHVPGNKTAVPLVVTAIVLAILAVLVTLFNRFCWHRLLSRDNSNVSEDSESAIKPKKSGRVVAIDTFRGMALSIMIFVNYGGGGYWFLNHSWWNGLTVADLVFPWFVWIMGVSMAISHRAARRSGASRIELSKKVLVRAIKLYALGCFINNGRDLSNWRFLGVLQYFGVSSLVVGLMAIWFPSPREEDDDKRYVNVLLDGDNDEPLNGLRPKRPSLFADFAPYWLQYAFIGFLLLVWNLVTYVMPVPGCPTGYTGPGGYGTWGQYPECTGGAHRYVDIQIFGEHHMYHRLDTNNNPISAATCNGPDRYNCAVYDPEGTMGFITATLMCFLGLQCGRTMMQYKQHSARVIRWVAWGLVLCGIGTLLCGASQNNGVMPLTKNLWSPSFVITQAGTGFLVLSVFYILVDWWGIWEGRPFKFMGMNSILVYTGSETLENFLPFTVMIHPPYDNVNAGFGNHTEFLISNVIGVMSWFAVSYGFYVHDFFYNL